MSNTTTDKEIRVPVSFAAIDTYVERNMISPRESKMTGERIRWGDGDKFPQYLCELYDGSATLRSIIDGSVDFIGGDDVRFRDGEGSPSRRMTAAQVVRALGYNEEKFGGMAFEVIRNAAGDVAEVNPLPMQYLRSNKNNTLFWYSEKWGKASVSDKPVRLLAFMPNLDWSKLGEDARKDHLRTVLYLKGDTVNTYPSPCYLAALKAAEMERSIDDYHLNSLDNGFAASAMVNFNNGIPTDEIKEEIERDFSEKFAGHSNSGRVVFSWNPNKDSQTTILPIKTEDFGAKYEALEKTSRQKIFTAFRANPNLFGIPTENLGFSSEEYESAFKLFNRTHVKPIQRKIADAFRLIYGVPVLEIIPFTLDGAGERVVE